MSCNDKIIIFLILTLRKVMIENKSIDGLVVIRVISNESD